MRSNWIMKSVLADQSRQALIDAARRMTPAERLKAFFEHSRLMVKLQEAGKRFRQFLRSPGRAK